MDTADAIRLDDRVIVVTGAGRGLGLSYVRLLSQRGAKVVVNDIVQNGESPAEVAAEVLRAAGGQAIGSTRDISTPEGGAALVADAVEAFGRLDGVVHNAGILRDRTLAKLSPEDVRDVFKVHLEAAFWVLQPAMEAMKANRFGRVVLTSSASGLFGNYGQSNYGAAKTGLVGLMRVLTQEGARAGVLVNTVAPSARTRMTEDLLGPLAERLDPDHVAPLVAYLCSARCETGNRIYSAGGGRYASVFLGLTPGWTRQGEGVATPEDIAAHIDQIHDRDGYIVPESGLDELAVMLKAMGAEHLMPG
ncbi:SDR family NAD(P)-dependent oxidoreductase [Brevundimonas staleyi]|uniref:SDR family NAD(P)-dependent oxidoreductase n=1 Tax=Brevundimonas staleyi TaxID=74326 RepID=A0ABW0FN89_9CAUL